MANNPQSSSVYDTLPERKAGQCNEVGRYSKYAEAIRHGKGDLAGFTRVAGDVSPEVRRAGIDLIIDEAARRGHSMRDIAYLLLIARLESGFNPDAAACSTSAAGVMQITDVTSKDLATFTSLPTWKKNNPTDVGINLADAADRFSARKNIIAGIIQYERCKTRAMLVLKTSNPSLYEPRVYQYYHAGLYFDNVKNPDPKKIDNLGLSEFNKHIQPLLNKVETALKSKGRFQAKLTQPDGKPYSNVDYVALVPKKWTEVVGDRIFGWVSNLFYAPALAGKDDGNNSKAASAPSAPAAASPPPTKSAPAAPPTLPPAPAASAAQSTKPIAYPARIQDGAKYDVVRGKTDGEGKTAEILVQGISEIYLCIFEYDYDKKVANLQQQREENEKDGKSDDSSAEPTSLSGDTSNQRSETVAATSSSNDDKPKEKNDDDGLNVEPTEQYTPRQMSAMYCGRKPDMEKIAEGFRQIGKPFETELMEFSRSYIVKPSAALGDAAPTNAELAANVQVEHISASVKKDQMKDVAKPVGKVNTAPENPNNVVPGKLLAPWMDIAIKERYQQQVSGGAAQNPEWRKAREEIKAKEKENKALNQELVAERRKPTKQHNEETIATLKARIDKNKSDVGVLLDRMWKIENDNSINNPRILEYFSVTAVPGNIHANNAALDDEINWCAAFVSWSLDKAGYKILPKGLAASAKEWVNYGEEVKEGSYGAVVVIGRGKSGAEGARTVSGQHVGFLAYEGKNRNGAEVIQMLGGNQGYDIDEPPKKIRSKLTRVTITEFKKSEWTVVARRFPKKEDKK